MLNSTGILETLNYESTNAGEVATTLNKSTIKLHGSFSCTFLFPKRRKSLKVLPEHHHTTQMVLRMKHPADHQDHTDLAWSSSVLSFPDTWKVYGWSSLVV